MAISVNTVYQTVLSILNKEQRGYLTPDEFNKIATQVQLEIFEKYFEDLNQQIRVPQTDLDYADRFLNLDEKIAIFKTFGEATYKQPASPPVLPNGLTYFDLPTQDDYNSRNFVYKIGTVTYTNAYGETVEVQRLSKTEFYNIQRSPLTQATENFPTYLYEGLPSGIQDGNQLDLEPYMALYVNPSTITSGINIDYIRKPNQVIWGFTVGNRGQYLYNNAKFDPGTGIGSLNFELDASEQTTVILRVLAYAGIVIEDPAIIQIASQQVQGREANKRS